MTTLTTKFIGATDLNVLSMLNVVEGELANINAQIASAGNIVPMSLSMKKAQLLSLLTSLKARKAAFFNAKASNDNKKKADFALDAALIALFIRNQKAKQQEERAREFTKRNIALAL